MIRALSRSLALLCLTTAGGVASAADSSWLLCKGIGEQGTGADKTRTYVVASVLEHRGAHGRDLAVSLIYGDRVSRGSAAGKNGDDFLGKDAPLKLSSVEGKHAVTFTGKGLLAQDMSKFTLTGSLDSAYGDADKPMMVPFVAKLVCEQLDDAAIGH